MDSQLPQGGFSGHGSAHIPSAWHITAAGRVKENMEKYYEGEREGAGMEVRRKKGGRREEERHTLTSLDSPKCYVLLTLAPSLPLSMLQLQHAMPFSPFAPEEILHPSATGFNASEATPLVLLLF